MLYFDIKKLITKSAILLLLLPSFANATAPGVCLFNIASLNEQFFLIIITLTPLLLQILIIYLLISGKSKRLLLSLQFINIVFIVVSVLLLAPLNVCENLYYPLVASIIFVISPVLLFFEILIVFLTTIIILAGKTKNNIVLVTVLFVATLMVGVSIYKSFPQTPGMDKFERNQVLIWQIREMN